MEKICFTVSRLRRLLLFMCMSVAGMMGAAVLIMLVGDATTPRVRIATVIQDVVGFVFPAVATAVMVTRRPADLLMLHTPAGRPAVASLLAMLAVIPAINWLVEWNAALPMPREWAEMAAESNARVSLLFGGAGPGSLVAALLIIGIMAPVAEELLFRGCLQRLLGSVTGTHAAIWITAALFSLVHLDMGGFVPRMALGVIFGYVMVWSGSVWTAVGCHAINNCLAVVAMWLKAASHPAGPEMMTFGADSIALTAASTVIASLLLAYAWRHRCAAVPLSRPVQ